jgi:hypothetical protein
MEIHPKPTLYNQIFVQLISVLGFIKIYTLTIQCDLWTNKMRYNVQETHLLKKKSMTSSDKRDSSRFMR